MTLADSNILIGAVTNHALRAWILAELPAVSVVTHVEALGYHRLSDHEKRTLEGLFAQLVALPVGAATITGAIALRQQRKMSLGDALIAATALEHRLALATANVEDFRWIDGLVVFDPGKAS
jgi:predicted nucleic acid-binding protein